ncbi:MAG: ribonuclease HI [Clostridiales bacterium]|nr:ribonuclease HI [Clostridiales bacterium]
MKKVTIYTDGACSGNPGPGGWGAVLMYNGVEKEMSGAEKETTNNRMELFAAISALRALKEPCEVDLYSDSAYLCNAINEGWLFDWKQKNWRNSNKKDVKNVDLWEELITLMGLHRITFIKVKGHADNVYNNRCDKLATSAILTIK